MASPLARLLPYVRRALTPPDADAALLDRFTRQRDEAAFAALVNRHGPMVFRVCRRVLGDADAAQDAFQAVWLVLARQARPTRPAHPPHGLAVRRPPAGGAKRPPQPGAAPRPASARRHDRADR